LLDVSSKVDDARCQKRANIASQDFSIRTGLPGLV
jgi:hypothetical protein